SPGHGADVVERRPRATRDDADHARFVRQGALARDVEQPFGREPLLEPLEGLEESAAPRWARSLGDPLEPPPALVDRGPPPQLDPRAFAEDVAGASRLELVHDALDAGVGALVLQGEVAVTARGAREARDLALHPVGAPRVLQREAQASRELRDPDDPFRVDGLHAFRAPIYTIAAEDPCLGGDTVPWRSRSDMLE